MEWNFEFHEEDVDSDFMKYLVLFCFFCNANPVLRVDSSTTDPPYWVGRIPLYHSSFLGICIIALGFSFLYESCPC